MENRENIDKVDECVLISIVIIVKNEGKRIQQCIDSLLDQKGFEQCEVVLVDGASTDNTRSVIQPYLKKYSNFKLVMCNRCGYAYQRNEGVLHSKGQYILFISGDVLCESNLILKYMNAIKKNFDVVQGTVIQKGDDRFTKLLYIFYQNLMKGEYEDISTVNILIKRTLFQGHMFDERIIASEDKIWYLTLDNKVNYYRMKSGIVFHIVHENERQYSQKIHREAIGIGISLGLKHRMWRMYDYFGWLRMAILGAMVYGFLFVQGSLAFIFSNSGAPLVIGMLVLLLYELYKWKRYKLYRRNWKEILLLERFICSASVGVLRGIIIGIFVVNKS